MTAPGAQSAQARPIVKLPAPTITKAAGPGGGAGGGGAGGGGPGVGPSQPATAERQPDSVRGLASPAKAEQFVVKQWCEARFHA